MHTHTHALQSQTEAPSGARPQGQGTVRTCQQLSTTTHTVESMLRVTARVAQSLQPLVLGTPPPDRALSPWKTWQGSLPFCLCSYHPGSFCRRLGDGPGRTPLSPACRAGSSTQTPPAGRTFPRGCKAPTRWTSSRRDRPRRGEACASSLPPHLRLLVGLSLPAGPPFPHPGSLLLFLWADGRCPQAKSNNRKVGPLLPKPPTVSGSQGRDGALIGLTPAVTPITGFPAEPFPTGFCSMGTGGRRSN